MVLIPLLRPGTWTLYSKSDPRWNASGADNVGAFVMPKGCKEKLEELKKVLGEPPEDLEWNYMKD
ncbi:MAG TPA: hypothetical protein VJ579_04945 [Candidatus Paceibacterota bacterium]|nr:hypothetical protein [Candidatus Paceibacterota bacterium]